MIEKYAKKKIKKDSDYANQIDVKRSDKKECLSKKLNYFRLRCRDESVRIDNKKGIKISNSECLIA